MVNVITGFLSIAFFVICVMKELFLLELQGSDYSSLYLQNPQHCTGCCYNNGFSDDLALVSKSENDCVVLKA